MSKFVMPDGREYEFSARAVTNKDAMLLETVTGKHYAQLVDDLEYGGPAGRTAFLWFAMRKNNHHVKYEELEFPMGETKFVLDEVDPTQASPVTPKDESPSLTTSKSGRQSPPS